MSGLARIFEILRRRGPGYPFYLLGGYLWPRWRYRILAGQSLKRRRFADLLVRAASAAAAGLLQAPWLGGRGAAFLGASLALLAAGIPLLAARLRQRRWLEKAREDRPDSTAQGPLKDLPGWREWPVESGIRDAVEAAHGARGWAAGT
ncbi:MAG: hypothetical protein KDD47_03130, partial [Acidobacteria bacterium]|nr:hypothetical protein [Acidobacteriota bacterium]